MAETQVKSRGFYDVSICETNSSSLEDICRTLISMGYRTAVINQTLEESVTENKKKKKKGEPREVIDLVPIPVCLTKLNEAFEGQLKLVNRLTFSFSDQLYTHKLSQSKNLKKYNVLAALPTTSAAFQYACSSLDVDIITFNPDSKNSVKFTRKMYNLAVGRGIFFELMYAPAILNSTLRRNIINTAHIYSCYGKSKNIVISSWAQGSFHIRSPYDVINLGLIFGMNEEQSKAAITESCRHLLLHGEGRRCGKTVVCIKENSGVAHDAATEEILPAANENEMEQDDGMQSAQKRLRQ